MKKYCFIFLALFFLPALARAESVSLTLDDATVEVGDQTTLTALLETESSVNVVDGTLVLPESLTLVRALTGASPLRFWMVNPVDAKSSMIRFAGMAPGGFSGKEELLTVIVTPKAPGAARIEAKDLAVYAHDGLGTERGFSDLTITLKVTPESEETEPIVIETPDTTPPSVTTEIVTDTSTGKEISYLLIYGQDKETAIRSYELIDNARVTPVETPFELDRGLLTTKAELVVTDAAFNKTRVPIFIPGRLELFGIHPTLFQLLIMTALVALGAFALTHILEMHPKVKSRVWPWT